MYCPLNICRKAVLSIDEGLRMAQCSFGLEAEGRLKERSEKSGGFGDAFCPGPDFDEGCCL